jgi:valyl-tRNA synthetase
MNLEGRTIHSIDKIDFTDLDRWIYHRLNEAAGRIKSAMRSYRFNDACQAGYEFFWNDFCDWYIEASKLSLYSEDEEEKDRAVSLLIALLEESMRLLHPFLSFITEEIYQKLPEHDESVMISSYPQPNPEREAPEAAAKFASVQELVRLVRTLRSELTIAPERKVSVSLRLEKDFAAGDMMRSMKDLIMSLCGAGNFVIVDGGGAAPGSLAVVGTGFEAYVDVKDAVDIGEELKRLEKELQKTEKQLQSAERKLENPSFLERAPEAVVLKERDKKQELSRQRDKLAGFIRELSS